MLYSFSNTYHRGIEIKTLMLESQIKTTSTTTTKDVRGILLASYKTAGQTETMYTYFFMNRAHFTVVLVFYSLMSLLSSTYPAKRKGLVEMPRKSYLAKKYKEQEM